MVSSSVNLELSILFLVTTFDFGFSRISVKTKAWKTIFQRTVKTTFLLLKSR